jgi:CBS domain containing-hemolysin-like protein
MTVGLFSIDPLKLQLLKQNGGVHHHNGDNGDLDPEEQKKIEEEREKVKKDFQRAKRLEPILSNHHYLLVTLLLCNAAAMEALPIFLDALVPTAYAIIISVTFVLIFGEVLPQALCTKDPLSIGSRFAPFIRFLMIVLWPIAYPIGKLLDVVLGHDDGKIYFSPHELKGLLDLHANVPHDPHDPEANVEKKLTSDQAMIMKGALDLHHKDVVDAMTPIQEVFMLDYNSVLNEDTMAKILAVGYSRIPVFEGHPGNIKGLILVKRLISIDPEENRLLKNISLREPLFVHPEMSLTDLLNLFQRGRSHLAVVSEHFEMLQKLYDAGERVPPELTVDGIITIEDVIEEIIQEEIEDELDVIREQNPEAKTPHRGVPLMSTDVAVQMAVDKFKKGLERRRKRKISVARREQSAKDFEMQHFDKVKMVQAVRSDVVMLPLREESAPPSARNSEHEEEKA